MKRKQNINIINYSIGDETEDAAFQQFIRGHIYIEALLGEMIERSYPNPSALDLERTMFAKKIKLLSAIGRIDQKMEYHLSELNRVRNKLAHRLDFDLSFETVFELANNAAKSDVDFSDETIYLDADSSLESYGIYGVVKELMTNTFSDLIWQNEDIFNKEDISNYLC